MIVIRQSGLGTSLNQLREASPTLMPRSAACIFRGAASGIDFEIPPVAGFRSCHSVHLSHGIRKCNGLARTWPGFGEASGPVLVAGTGRAARFGNGAAFKSYTGLRRARRRPRTPTARANR